MKGEREGGREGEKERGRKEKGKKKTRKKKERGRKGGRVKAHTSQCNFQIRQLHCPCHLCSPLSFINALTPEPTSLN